MNQPFSMFNHSFSNFDYFEEAAKGWDLNIKKLNTGNYKGSLLQIVNEKVIITDVNIGRTLEINGSPLSGYKTFGIPKINCAPFYWRYKNLSDNTIQIYSPGSELFMINKYEMGAIDISIKEDYFYKLCEKLKYENLIDTIVKNEFLICDLKLLRKLQNKMASITNLVEKFNPEKYHFLVNEINYEIPILLIKTIASVNKISKIDKPFTRTNAIKKIIALVEEAPTEYHSLSNLSNATNVSERTLQYSFKEKFSVSPSKFVKNIKLNSIYRLLKKGSTSVMKVSDIANQYGFWHMGQFANDYKNLFGELPSSTLASKR